MLKNTLILLLLNLTFTWAQNPETGDTTSWSVTFLTNDDELNRPHEIELGPDGYLWIAERKGKKISKVSTSGGAPIQMLDMNSVVTYSGGQGGIIGMAIHPDLYTNLNTVNNYVYIAYTYLNGSSNRRLRIVRHTYNTTNGTLNNDPFTLLENLRASNDHNSGKLKMGPDLKLYYTIGDQGANQFANACNTIQAQDLPTSATNFGRYKGKILRINLDGTVPVDNPTLGGVKTHVYTYGHRNAQGLVFGNDGTLYSSEHGAKVDDELNIIEAGKNYGWPLISGYYDGFAYTYCDWSSASNCNSGDFSDHNCASGVVPVDEFTSGTPFNFQEPIGTFNSTTENDPAGGFLTWPTVAPSGLDIYEGGIIPSWGKCLLIPTLKKGTIYRAKLNANGDGLEDGTFHEFHSSADRYRDLAVDPDGLTIYAVTDNTGQSSGPTGSSNLGVTNKGRVVKIQYIGQTLGVQEVVQINKFSILPNPAITNFRLQFDSKINQSVNIQIIDVQGRLVKTVNSIKNNQNINVTNLKSGMYLVKIYNVNNKEINIKKLIIK